MDRNARAAKSMLATRPEGVGTVFSHEDFAEAAKALREHEPIRCRVVPWAGCQLCNCCGVRRK